MSQEFLEKIMIAEGRFGLALILLKERQNSHRKKHPFGGPRERRHK